MRPPTIKTIAVLSSWWTVAALSAAIAAPYVIFSFTGEPYDRWAAFLTETLPGLLLYILLAVSLSTASLRAIKKRLPGPGATPEDIALMDTYIVLDAGTGAQGKGVTPTAVREWMKKRGFVLNNQDKRLAARKGRLSFIPGSVLRVGLVVLMASLLASSLMRREEEAIARNGEMGVLLGTEFTVEQIYPGLPGEFLQVGDKSEFKTEGTSAKLYASDRSRRVTAGFPTYIDGIYWRIRQMGFHQPLVIMNRKPAPQSVPDNASPASGAGGTRNAGAQYPLDLDLLPPGKACKADLVSGISASLVLEPEETITKGLLTGKLYRLDNPLYRIGLKAGDETTELLLHSTEAAEVGNMDISLEGHSVYLKIKAVSDPALLWVYAGVLITLIGAALMLTRFFWYEKHLCAAFKNGQVLIGYSEEFYKKWGILKFQRWADELKERQGPEGSESGPSVEVPEPSGEDQDTPKQRP